MMQTICEENLGGSCPSASTCNNIHHRRTFLWQVKMDTVSDWRNLETEGEELELYYCEPKQTNATVQTVATGADESVVPASMEIDFCHMLATVTVQSAAAGVIIQIRRLSTSSYVCRPSVNSAVLTDPGYFTQWRWYWWNKVDWIPFKDEFQSVLERKLLYGQQVYRFETDVNNSATSAASNTDTYLLDFQQMNVMCISQNTKEITPISRRPLPFTTPCRMPWLIVKHHPFINEEVPENWVPMDPDCDYELVPLNPTSVQYDLVAGEFHTSIPAGHKICDVFRLQNPYLWQKFSSKRKLMELKGSASNELLLFHGTSSEVAIQSICKQNFDWRVYGKNNIIYGKGSYFARDAAFSDKYSAMHGTPNIRWMFFARVLVGRFVKGNSAMVRPPPLDATKPHGDLYDSCVNSVGNPTVYVIFDSEQCYPEYLLSYK